MRKALEFPRIDEGKLDAVEALIAAIADKEPGTAGAELEDLAALTGKVHTDVEFAEYWSWTDLDTLARLTLTPEPPCIPDLSREELVELVEIIQHCSVTGREWAMRYYTALLRAPSPCPMSWTLWPPVKMWRSLQKSCSRRPGKRLSNTSRGSRRPRRCREPLFTCAAAAQPVSHTGVCYFQRAKRRKKGLFFMQKGRNTEQSPQLFAHL